MARNSAVRKLRQWQTDIQATPEAIKGMPKALAPKIKAELDAAIAAGRSVDGKAWAPRKSDGAKAMQGAQNDISVKPTSDGIKIVLEGGPVFSEFGTRHQQARPLLAWDKGIPPKLGNAVRLGVISFPVPFMTRAGSHGSSTRGLKW